MNTESILKTFYIKKFRIKTFLLKVFIQIWEGIY